MTRKRTLTTLLGIVSMTMVVSAHHSQAMYEPEKLVSIEGVVKSVQWKSPHMWITVDVPSANGKTESWDFEGAAAAPMVASGISPQLLKVGTRVKIIAHPARDISKRIAEFMGMEVNGKYYARGTETNVRGKVGGP